MIQEPNNEQKLTYIYNTLKEQEARRVRAIWYKFSKWTIYLGLIYLAVTNASLIIGKMTEIIQPIVMDQMKILLEKNKGALMESMKNMIPVDTLTQEIQTQVIKNTPPASQAQPKKPSPKY